ncbi:transposase [Sphingobium sp. AS12]|nr:transposase [Sphingobium sp. AS12]
MGQKNKITRRWARRGTRPSAPKDQRTKSAYILGAICPELGKGAGLILPFCNTQTMSLHLAEISLAIEPGAHGVLLMDQAGWHMTGKLEVPDNISIVPLPPKCPELNPVENIWHLWTPLQTQAIFEGYRHVVGCCHLSGLYCSDVAAGLYGSSRTGTISVQRTRGALPDPGSSSPVPPTVVPYPPSTDYVSDDLRPARLTP